MKWFLALLAALGACAAFAQGSVTISDIDNQSHVDVAPGTMVIVNLQTRPDQGDSWLADKSILTLFRSLGNPMYLLTPGGGVTQYRLVARREGSVMAVFRRSRQGQVVETFRCLLCVTDGRGTQTISIGPSANNSTIYLDGDEILQVVLPYAGDGGKWVITQWANGINLLPANMGYPSGDWGNQYFRFGVSNYGASGFLRFEYQGPRPGLLKTFEVLLAPALGN